MYILNWSILCKNTKSGHLVVVLSALVSCVVIQTAFGRRYSELMEGSYISGKAKVSGNFESLDFVVSNSDGKIVYEQRLENVLPGDLSLMWNGKDLTGEQQPSGKYSLKLTATDNGKQTNIPVSTAQTISSVKWNEAKNEVLVEISDGRTFSLQSLEQFNI